MRYYHERFVCPPPYKLIPHCHHRLRDWERFLWRLGVCPFSVIILMIRNHQRKQNWEVADHTSNSVWFTCYKLQPFNMLLNHWNRRPSTYPMLLTACNCRWPWAIFAGVFKIRITLLKPMQYVALLWDFSQITYNIIQIPTTIFKNRFIIKIK